MYGRGMSRATRVEFPGAIYHAMGLAMPGAKAFPSDEDRERFLECVGSLVERGDLAKGEAPIDPLERATAGLVLGGETFVAWVRAQVKDRPESHDEPSLRRLRALGLASPERVEKAVKAEFGDPCVPGRARSILAALLVSRTGLRPSEVARRLGVSRSAITKSVLRVDERMCSDAAVAKRVRRITAGLLGAEGAQA